MEEVYYISTSEVEEGQKYEYNCRVKIYPDGVKQYMLYPGYKQKNYKRGEVTWSGLTVERKEEENQSRAMQIIYDLARSNSWDWFVTLTFSPVFCDRSRFEEVVPLLGRFTDIIRHNGCKWLLVPDVHDDGCYHFHGLIKGSLNLEVAINPHTGAQMFDESGREIYNIINYRYGFSTVTAVDDVARVSSYMTKYITKKVKVPKGFKRYWASKKLERPEVRDAVWFPEQFSDLIQKRYVKTIDSDYGTFYLLEE